MTRAKAKPKTQAIVSQDAQSASGLDPQEIGPLARELARKYQQAVKYYQREYQMEPEQANAEAQKHRSYELPLPEPEDVSWYDIENLAANDPEASLALWQQVKTAARDEFESGWRGAQVMEQALSSNAWQRAQYIAVRSSLVDYWKPHPGELPLIDTMAQTYTMFEWYMQIAVLYTTLEAHEQKEQYDKEGYVLPARVRWLEAKEAALATADKFNRLYLRTMRHLQNLRRYAPPVTIQSAGQVNIAGQQVNLSNQSQVG
jgi:tetratricopeptide (TPR) repeat protein